MNNKLSVLMVAAGIAAVVAATALAGMHRRAHAASSTNGVTPIQFAGSTATAAATPMPAAAALAAVQKQLGPTAVSTADITPAPLDSQRGALPWLHAVVDVPATTDGQDVEPIWEAELLEGAVAERVGSSSDIRDGFGGATIDVRLPDGKTIPDYGGGLGDVVRGQQFSNPSDAQIRGAAKSAAAQFSLRIDSVRVFRAAAPAPAVVVTAADPASAAANLKNIESAMFGDPPSYEGYYLAVNDTAGAPVIRASAAFRTGAGQFWIRPDLADQSSVKSLGIPPR